MGIQDKTNRGIKICMRIFIFILFLMAPEISFGEETITPQQALKKAVENMYSSNVIFTCEMIIKRPNKEYKKRLKIYLKNKDKSLVEFLYPPKEDGLRILSKQDIAWMYLPSVEKIMRLSGKTSVAGSDFIYQDILRVRWDEDYNAVSIKEEGNKYILELRAKSKDVAYKKIVYFVDKKTLLPLEAHFYVLEDRLLKTLTYKEPKLIKGRLIPTILIMQNAFTEDYKTILKMEDVDFKPISDRVFTQEYLKKGL